MAIVRLLLDHGAEIDIVYTVNFFIYKHYSEYYSYFSIIIPCKLFFASVSGLVEKVLP